jgi:hypothetical protein
MMNRMCLIDQHCVSIVNSFVIIMVMKGGSCWTAANYRTIRLDSPSLVLLIAKGLKYAL